MKGADGRLLVVPAVLQIQRQHVEHLQERAPFFVRRLGVTTRKPFAVNVSKRNVDGLGLRFGQFRAEWGSRGLRSHASNCAGEVDRHRGGRRRVRAQHDCVPARIDVTGVITSLGTRPSRN